MNHAARWLKPGTWREFLIHDVGLAATFFVIGVVSRIPFRGQWLYHWDSVNFALGMERFDVRLHQPHPPGYLLYVLLGRLVNLFVGDTNASLVWISIVFGGLTVVAVYLLGRRLFGRAEAIVAAVFVLTGPAFWFYNEVALTYTVEAFFVTAIALACLETRRGNQRLVLVSAFLLGLAGGVRQTTLVLMLPLWLFSLWRCHWQISVAACVLLGVTVLAWLVPTVLLSGGPGPYLEASRSIGGGVLSDLELFSAGQSLLASLGPFVRLGVYLVYGLMFGLVPLLYGIVKGVGKARTWLRQWRSDTRAHVMALWLIPNLVLYAPLVRAPGHTFSFMPALVLLAAAALVAFCRDVSGRLRVPTVGLTVSLTGLIVAVNVAFFLAAPPYLFGIQRVVTTTPSWPTIHHRDRYLAGRVTYITQHFDPATTVILTAGPDYRHPDYYLRDYYALNCTADGSLVSDAPTESRTLVLLSDGLTSRQDGVQAVVLPDGEVLRYLQLYADSEIVVDQFDVSVRPRS